MSGQRRPSKGERVPAVCRCISWASRALALTPPAEDAPGGGRPRGTRSQPRTFPPCRWGFELPAGGERPQGLSGVRITFVISWGTLKQPPAGKTPVRTLQNVPVRASLDTAVPTHLLPPAGALGARPRAPHPAQAAHAALRSGLPTPDTCPLQADSSAAPGARPPSCAAPCSGPGRGVSPQVTVPIRTLRDGRALAEKDADEHFPALNGNPTGPSSGCP